LVINTSYSTRPSPLHLFCHCIIQHHPFFFALFWSLHHKTRQFKYTEFFGIHQLLISLYIPGHSKFNLHLTLLSASFTTSFLFVILLVPSIFIPLLVLYFHKNTMKNKAYTILMGLELTLIGIKYEGSNTNPFQHSTPILLLFLTATCSHLLASTAQTTCPTIFIFHVSGVVGCEALLWILISPEFIWWYIINLLLLLLASFCFNYNHINQLISHTTHDPNLASPV